MKRYTLIILGLCPFALANAQVINEFVNDHVGPDTHEFVEIFGAPNTDLSFLTIVEIEGDGVGSGLIDDATFTVGTTDGNGFWVTSFGANVQENGSMTFLLVTGYTGSLGDDIDTNNDGIIDVTFWSAIIDSVAVDDFGASDHTYSDSALSDFGGASRIPNGIDTNAIDDWIFNDFDGAGLPGFGSSNAPGTALNTPGAVNAVPEPASMIVLGLGAAALLRRRRGR